MKRKRIGVEAEEEKSNAAAWSGWMERVVERVETAPTGTTTVHQK